MVEYRLAPKARDDMETLWLYSSQVTPTEACPRPEQGTDSHGVSLFKLVTFTSALLGIIHPALTTTVQYMDPAD